MDWISIVLLAAVVGIVVWVAWGSGEGIDRRGGGLPSVPVDDAPRADEGMRAERTPEEVAAAVAPGDLREQAAIAGSIRARRARLGILEPIPPPEASQVRRIPTEPEPMDLALENAGHLETLRAEVAAEALDEPEDEPTMVAPPERRPARLMPAYRAPPLLAGLAAIRRKPEAPEPDRSERPTIEIRVRGAGR